MELTENEIIEKYGKNSDIVIEIFSCHMNMNFFVYRSDIT